MPTAIIHIKDLVLNLDDPIDLSSLPREEAASLIRKSYRCLFV